MNAPIAGIGPGYPRLLGDIGGTHARWAWQSAPGAGVEDIVVKPCDADASLADSALHYLEETGHGRPRWAGIGIATAVTGDAVRMTNHPWAFSISELRRALEAERCLVINDFTALAMSLPALGERELVPLGGGQAVEGATLALLGAGTGLGVSGLVPCPKGGWQALSGEGGHVTLAAADDEESDVIAWLRGRFGHVSAERVLSGAGLVNLHDAARALAGRPPRTVAPADVTQGAASDPDCARALALFTAFLGSVAGNLALTLGARGGVYVGGGIVPRLGPLFDAALFRRRFEGKGRFEEYLRAVPAWLITASTPALLGATRALDLIDT